MSYQFKFFNEVVCCVHIGFKFKSLISVLNIWKISNSMFSTQIFLEHIWIEKYINWFFYQIDILIEKLWLWNLISCFAARDRHSIIEFRLENDWSYFSFCSFHYLVEGFVIRTTTRKRVSYIYIKLKWKGRMNSGLMWNSGQSSRHLCIYVCEVADYLFAKIMTRTFH